MRLGSYLEMSWSCIQSRISSWLRHNLGYRICSTSLRLWREKPTLGRCPLLGRAASYLREMQINLPKRSVVCILGGILSRISLYMRDEPCWGALGDMIDCYTGLPLLKKGSHLRCYVACSKVFNRYKFCTIEDKYADMQPPINRIAKFFFALFS